MPDFVTKQENGLWCSFCVAARECPHLFCHNFIRWLVCKWMRSEFIYRIYFLYFKKNFSKVKYRPVRGISYNFQLRIFAFVIICRLCTLMLNLNLQRKWYFWFRWLAEKWAQITTWHLHRSSYPNWLMISYNSSLSNMVATISQSHRKIWSQWY